MHPARGDFKWHSRGQQEAAATPEHQPDTPLRAFDRASPMQGIETARTTDNPESPPA